jgi:flagellar hook-length control protein FliK
MIRKAATALKNAVSVKGEAANEAAALKTSVEGIKTDKKQSISESSETESKIAPGIDEKKKSSYGPEIVSSKKPSVMGEKMGKGEKDGRDDKALKPGKGKLRINDQRKASREISAQKTDRTLFNAETKDFVKDALKAADESDSVIELKGLGEVSKAADKAAAARSHQSALFSQLKDSVNSQIVKQAGITVKDNGTGEIRLVLKPESLGKVRISLSLTDNHIAGRIIVENNIVREVFESNLENLYKAFGSEGFENGGLEVTVEGEGAGNSGRNKPGGFKGKAFRVLEDSVPEMVESEWQYNVVNMVV